MPVKNIIPGQKITPEKFLRARELRREMTPAEEKLWQALRRDKLGGYHFRRQQIIAGYIVDFYCHAAGLVIEIDGGIHENQKEYDAERDSVFIEMGLKVLHISNEVVMESLPRVLKTILRDLIL